MPSEIMTGKASSDIENVDWSTGTTSGRGDMQYPNVVRFGSSSSQASQSSGDICRICHCESDPQNPLLTPCYCSGSLKYVHQTCLQQWLTASETNACELCKFPFIMHTKIKPFNEWRSLDMSGVERRRLCCAVLFHCAAALCVIWSLCVLIERAAEEVKRGLIGWPFWTKLAVVTVGLTGGVVFMYIQCRQYLHLCHRWRARNRILLIQNAPEKVHPLSQPSPVMTTRLHMNRNNSSTVVLAASASNPQNNNNTNNGSNIYCYNVTNLQGNNLSDSVPHMQINYPNSIGGNSINFNNHTMHVQHGQIIAKIENCGSQNYEPDISTASPTNAGLVVEENGMEEELSPNDIAINSAVNKVPSHPYVRPTLYVKDTNTQSSMMNSTSNGNAAASTNNAVDANNSSSNNNFKLMSAGGIKYPTSSVFLENRDILNDIGYPKINYRHSSILTSPEITDNLNKFLDKDIRRYSDTKLMQTDVINSVNPSINRNIFPEEDRSYINNVLKTELKTNSSLPGSDITGSDNDDVIDVDGTGTQTPKMFSHPGDIAETSNANNNLKSKMKTQQNTTTDHYIYSKSNDLSNTFYDPSQVTDIIFETENYPSNNQFSQLNFDLNTAAAAANTSFSKNPRIDKKKSRHSLNGIELYGCDQSKMNDHRLYVHPNSVIYWQQQEGQNNGQYRRSLQQERGMMDENDQQRNCTNIASTATRGGGGGGIAAAAQDDIIFNNKSRTIFKSLPNLSSSCESLIKK